MIMMSDQSGVASLYTISLALCMIVSATRSPKRVLVLDEQVRPAISLKEPIKLGFWGV